jgi:hypothetical protein
VNSSNQSRAIVSNQHRHAVCRANPQRLQFSLGHQAISLSIVWGSGGRILRHNREQLTGFEYRIAVYLLESINLSSGFENFRQIDGPLRREIAGKKAVRPASKQAASQIGQAFRTLPLPTDTVWLSGALRVRKICGAIASYSHETYPYPSESFALYSKQSTILPTKFKSTIGFNQKIAIPGALNWGGRHQHCALP